MGQSQRDQSKNCKKNLFEPRPLRKTARNHRAQNKQTNVANNMSVREKPSTAENLSKIWWKVTWAIRTNLLIYPAVSCSETRYFKRRMVKVNSFTHSAEWTSADLAKNACFSFRKQEGLSNSDSVDTFDFSFSWQSVCKKQYRLFGRKREKSILRCLFVFVSAL